MKIVEFDLVSPLGSFGPRLLSLMQYLKASISYAAPLELRLFCCELSVTIMTLLLLLKVSIENT